MNNEVLKILGKHHLLLDYERAEYRHQSLLHCFTYLPTVNNKVEPFVSEGRKQTEGGKLPWHWLLSFTKTSFLCSDRALLRRQAAHLWVTEYAVCIQAYYICVVLRKGVKWLPLVIMVSCCCHMNDTAGAGREAPSQKPFPESRGRKRWEVRTQLRNLWNVGTFLRKYQQSEFK